MLTLDSEFVRCRTLEVTLRTGARVRLRPVVPEDKERMVQALERLSPESRYRRFMTAVTRMPPRQLAYFTELDYVNHHAIGALALDEPGEPGIGVARFVRLAEEPDVAEVALTVIDDYHRSGLGTLLLQALMAVALEQGIRQLRAEILGENRAARRLVGRFGARIQHSGNTCLFVIDVPQQAEALRGTELHDLLRAMARGELVPVR
jgi:RimJ/RimL family protein N-acetyltransferase